MRNIIINNILVLLFISIVFSCKNSKVFDVDGIVHRVYEGEDITILDKYFDYKVENLSSFDDDIIRGTTFIRSKEKEITYLWFYVNDSDYSDGMVILMLNMIRNKNHTQSYYFKDYKFIPGFSNNRIQYGKVSYGEPIVEKGYTHYAVKDNIYGIYAYEGKNPPYYKKVMPKYLVYVENGKLVVEEPKDDKYFIYRIPEL